MRFYFVDRKQYASFKEFNYTAKKYNRHLPFSDNVDSLLERSVSNKTFAPAYICLNSKG